MPAAVFPAGRRRSNSVFLGLCLAAALFGLLFLVLILISLLYNGIAGLSLVGLHRNDATAGQRRRPAQCDLRQRRHDA